MIEIEAHWGFCRECSQMNELDESQLCMWCADKQVDMSANCQIDPEIVREHERAYARAYYRRNKAKMDARTMANYYRRKALKAAGNESTGRDT